VQTSDAKSAWRGRQIGVLVTMCLASIVIVMDGSIVNVALPTLSRELAGSTNARLQWIVDAYVLVFATLLMPAGSAADRVGRRLVFLLGLVVFAATSVGASRADSASQLILWRALMGVGAAMIFPSTLAIISETFPEPSRRATAIACWAGSSGLGVAIGPIAAGATLARLHWGWILLLNLPIVALAFAGTAAFVSESQDRARGRLDVPGASLAALAVFAMVFGIIEAPEQGWLAGRTLVPIALGLIAMLGFVRWEKRCATPLLDVRSFLDRRFGGACLALTVAFFGLFGFVFMVTQFFQFIQGHDALHAGIRTLPFAGFILAGAVIAASLGKRVDPTFPMASGLALMSVGFLWSSRAHVDMPYLTMVGQMGFLGVGLGLVNALGTDAIMGSLPRERAGTGSSVNDTLRELGGTLGVACMGSAFNALYRTHITDALASSPLPASARDAVRASVGSASFVIQGVRHIAGDDLANVLEHAVQSAFMRGFEVSCWIATAITLGGALALLASATLRAAKSAA